MKATAQLKAEHEGITLMLQILENVSQRLESGEQVDPAHLEKIIEFIRVFADRCHHAKEEDLLFPALEAAGIPKESGPVGIMLLEHDEGRKHVRGMADALSRYRDAGAPAGRDFAMHAREYVALLSEHIEKENQVLYEMADSVLSESKQDELFGQFERIEEERIGHGKHEEFHRLLEELARIYLK
ncbi:MAG: hemerythrin domain-containing protein [Thermodesulfobacteriota bacterium]